MQIFKTSREVETSRLPPTTKAAVMEAVKALEEIFGQGFNCHECGYVVLVEQDDTPATVMDLYGRFLCQIPIEGVFTQHGCLFAVTINGNSGEGITWVCPDIDDYAPEIRSKLKGELTTNGGQDEADQR
jgi:hypothetical protein